VFMVERGVATGAWSFSDFIVIQSVLLCFTMCQVKCTRS
jgi:hypothetical protein